MIQLNQGTYYPGVEYITRRVMEEATTGKYKKILIEILVIRAKIHFYVHQTASLVHVIINI